MTDVLVLGYHAVSDDWDWRFAVTVAQLERQLQLVLRRGYRPVTFAEAAAGSETRVVAVTFDDAFGSVFERGLPVLDRLHIPATVFAVSDFTGTDRPLAFGALSEYLGGPYEPELRAMTWERLAQLADVGWEIGSHTRTHRDLTTLGDDELAEELGGSKRAIEERLGRRCTTFAYPFGATDARVRAAVGAAGYAAAADFPPRFERPSRYAWPRVGVYRDDDDRGFARKTSLPVRRLRASGVGRRVLDVLRALP